MHTEDCPPLSREQLLAVRAEWMKWWPQGQPSEIDVSTLPAAGAITQPERLIGAGEWLGIWGNYQGLRIGYKVTESFQVMSPCAVRYPQGVDLYLSQDTGGSGIASLGRFLTREAALAWGGSRPSSPGKIVPGGSFAPADGVANPTTVLGAEAFNMGFNGTTWDRVRSSALNADSITPVTLGAVLAAAQGLVYNDRTTNLDRLRQPDSKQSVIGNASAVSLNSTGVKFSYTVPSNKNTRACWLTLYNLSSTVATVRVELVRSAVTYFLNIITLGAAVGPTDLLTTQAHPYLPLVSGDVLQVNVTAAGATTADINFGAEVDRFTF